MLAVCRAGLKHLLGDGTAITVVADAASVGSDAGSIRHEGPVIVLPVLSNGSQTHRPAGMSVCHRCLPHDSVEHFSVEHFRRLMCGGVRDGTPVRHVSLSLELVS